jgi:hypothetical protein
MLVMFWPPAHRVASLNQQTGTLGRPLGWFIVLALLTSACTIVTYGGPRRSREQVAILYAGNGTKIVRVDGRPFKGDKSQKFEVLPGQHSVSITTFEVNHYIVMKKTTWARPTTTCASFIAGHEYTFDRQEKLQLFKIIDVTTNKFVPEIDCPEQGDEIEPEEWDRPPA